MQLSKIIITVTLLILMSGCKPADTRIRLKPRFEFTGDRNSQQYQDMVYDVVYQMWLQRELRRMEKEYAARKKDELALRQTQ